MEQRDFEIMEEGSWGDIVTFCSRLADSLKDTVSRQDYERFEDWRPKPDESKHRLREKSAEEAAIHQTGIEKKSQGARKEMANAGKGVRKSGKDMVNGHAQESLRDVEEAGTSAVRSLFPPIIRLFRALEEVLYVNVMERTSPSYFECSEFTVALEREILDRATYRARIVFEEKEEMEHVLRELDGRED